MIPADFHFLRPEWLLAIIPAVLLAIFAWRRVGSGRSNWARVVDSHLLKHLVLKEKARSRKWPVIALLAGWTLASVAAAGPAWERLPTPALGRIDPTVIVMSLAQSMNATDQSPTRLTRARHKAEDILARMKGGQVGLVVFADAPFVAAPLTEDSKVVSQMMPELATDLMPVLNDRLDLAITRAAELLKNAGAASGRIVVLTDSLGDEPQYSIDAAKTAASEGYDVNVIGVGTATGAPLVAYDGTTMRDKSGNTRMTRMDEAALKSLAVAGHGEFSPLTAGDGDLDKVLAQAVSPVSANPLTDTDLKADEWRDMGPWLLLLPLVLAPLAFRRGWLSAIVLAAVLSAGVLPGALPAGRAFAADEAAGAAPTADTGGQAGDGSLFQRPGWKNLWQTPDQQGASAFASGDYATAAQSFQNPAWQASALYKAGEYDKAAGAFQSGASADYNKGNALARAGKLEDAIKSYDAALAANPGDADAKYNRDLVQKLLDQQKQQQQQQDQQNQKNDDQQSSDQQKGGGKGQDGKDQQDQSQGQNGKNDDKSDKNQDSAQDQSDQKNGGKGADDQQQAGKDQSQDKSQDKSQDQAGNQPQDQKDQPGKDDPSKGGQQGDQDQASQGDQQQNAQNGGDQQDKAGQDKAQQDNAQDQQQAGDQQQQSGGQSQGQDQQPQQAASGGDPAADKAAQENAQSELKKALDEAINKSRAAQTAQAGKPAQPQPQQQNQQQAAVEGTGAMTEEDQNREQMLRMIPDDPTGLLRARIRSHYSNLGLTQ
ncbi:Ca-activated chloride channel family protein [Pseudoxanthobacter soli DSM 19599]|uniref:Ca-activated chloride channel family protein n=1 Tax=Pseudoxanthobacter soli DSM 19599 TaxID=1123029 RepID=A0A1M7ZRF2_9HYPH|nr:VWA domain-containing protein [Pseudoxanthobacter soli]SHO67488.1 Ca-activated chloride channel family protein [Pseudoxanthobacter soli DSM 19599]